MRERQSDAAGETRAGIGSPSRFDLLLLAETYAVCRLESDAPLPHWSTAGPFVSITRTDGELSVVCRQDAVPGEVRCERGWRCLRVIGALDFSLVGVLASLLDPLARAGVSVFVVSTFDTDYLLVKEGSLESGVESLRRQGVRVLPRNTNQAGGEPESDE
jgi:hypothetical protein